MKIDITKPLKTRDGRNVTIISDKGRHPKHPIMGYIGEDTNLSFWTAEGAFFADEQSNRDLIHLEEGYFNIYPANACMHPTRTMANAKASPDRLACIKVSYTVGQFDD